MQCNPLVNSSAGKLDAVVHDIFKSWMPPMKSVDFKRELGLLQSHYLYLHILKRPWIPASLSVCLSIHLSMMEYRHYLVTLQLCMSCAKHTVWQKQKNLVISGSIVQCSFDEQTSRLTSSMKHCATEELPSLQVFILGSLELNHLSFYTP